MKGAPAALKKKGGFLCLLASWAAVALVYGLDQWSKHWVLHSKILRLGGRVGFVPSLDFVLVWNRAVTFGMLGGVASRFGPVVFIALALAAVLALAVVSWRSRFCWVRLCCGFIMGGALGNVHDRLRYGAVVDFIHFYIGSWSWYIFNLADAAIVGGVLGWMGFSFLFPNSKVPADPKISGPGIPSSGKGRNVAAGN